MISYEQGCEVIEIAYNKVFEIWYVFKIHGK